jgi:hypothetical protein
MRGFYKLGLGLGLFAYFLVAAGAIGSLNQLSVWIFIALCWTCGWKTLPDLVGWAKIFSNSLYDCGGRFAAAVKWTLAISVFFTGLFCFLPEISNDALAIHLHLAKLFARHASVEPLYYDMFSYRPLLMSVLYSVGILFQNVAIAKLFHWLTGLLLISVLWVQIFESTQRKNLALFFALMLWLTPTLMNQITTTYLDAAVTLFIFLGVRLALNDFETLKPSNFFYGGLFIGLAVSARSLALGAFFAVLIMLAVHMLRRKDKSRAIMMSALWVTVGVTLSSMYWFIRDWIHTGNPCYPYLGSLFGTEEYNFFSSIYFHGMGLPRSLGSFLCLPFDITFRPQYFDYHHWVGPFYLSVFPFAAYAAFKVKNARRHLLFVFLLTVFWYFTGQDVRYLLPALPFYLIAAAMGLNALSLPFFGRGWGSIISKTIASVAIASLLSLTAYHFRYQFMPVLRIWSSEQYLKKMERIVPAAEWINTNLPVNATILLLGEVHLYYFDRKMIPAEDFDLRTHFLRVKSPADLVMLLKEKGLTHILDASNIIKSQPGYSPPSSENSPLRTVLLDSRFSKKTFSVSSANIVGLRRHYDLYELV